LVVKKHGQVQALKREGRSGKAIDDQELEGQGGVLVERPMIDNKFCMLLEMSKINYDYLLTEIILLCNSQRINGFLFFIFVKYYGVEGFG
jgi:hypothetical protein